MLTDRIITATVYALLHSLWQALLIVMILLIFNRAVKSAGSKLKYSVSFLSLFGISASSVATFYYYFKEQAASALASASYNIAALPEIPSENSAVSADVWSNVLESYSGIIFTLWFSGMTVFFIKFCIDLYYADSIRKKECVNLPDAVTISFVRIAARLGIKKAVRFIESPIVKVPAVIGYFKPAVILPLGLISKIPSDQLEAVISHELAHIARNDFLHNMIQSLIEIVYFFNPSVLIISKMIRTERENCCDDLAVMQCTDSALLAKGLYNLELLHSGMPKSIMAAAGNRNNLLCRIKRLIGKEKDMTKTYSGFFASLAALTVITVVTGCTLFASGQKEQEIRKEEVKTVIVKGGGDVDNEKIIVIKKRSDDGKYITMDIIADDDEECKDGNEKKIIIQKDGDGKTVKKVIVKKGNSVRSDVSVGNWCDGNILFMDSEDDDIDIDFGDIEEELEKAMAEIEKEKLSDEQKNLVKEKVKLAMEKLKLNKKKLQLELRKAKLNNEQQMWFDQSSSTKILIDDKNKLEISDDRIILLTGDGKEEVIEIDKTKIDDLKKKLAELKEKYNIDVKVLDDCKDIMIYTSSDSLDKDIKKLKKINMIIKDDDAKWVEKAESGDFEKLWNELIKDGLFKEKQDNLKLEIEDDEIEINGVEIPSGLFEKYKKLLEGL